MLRNRPLVLAMLSAWVLCAMLPIASGSGFAIIEQSPSRIGTAFAGATANNEDAGAIYWNPAGMTGVSNVEVIVGLNAVCPSFTFTDTGSTPLGGGNGGDAGVTAWVPNFYAVMGLTDTVKAGVGVFAPYGLKTEYDENWVGRFAAVKTELITLDINPSLAVTLSDSLSVGAGVTIESAEAELTSKTPLGPGMEGLATVKGDDWGYGFNLGAMCVFPCGTRVGLSYRSSIEHELDGDIIIGPLPSEGGGATIELPESASIGVHIPLSDALAIMADAAWTGWSSFSDLTVTKADGSVLSAKDESWEDTWRFALGLTYQVNEDLVLRTGAAYDQTPVPDAEHRTARIPDADRTWLSAGVGMNLTDYLTLDVGYVHLWFNDSAINETYAPDMMLVGTYEGEVDIVSLQLKIAL